MNCSCSRPSAASWWSAGAPPRPPVSDAHSRYSIPVRRAYPEQRPPVPATRLDGSSRQRLDDSSTLAVAPSGGPSPVVATWRRAIVDGFIGNRTTVITGPIPAPTLTKANRFPTRKKTSASHIDVRQARAESIRPTRESAILAWQLNARRRRIAARSPRRSSVVSQRPRAEPAMPSAARQRSTRAELSAGAPDSV